MRDQIAVDPKAGLDEKKKMMDMLRRFEDAQAGEDGALVELDEAGEESEDELEQALADIDLGTCLSNGLSGRQWRINAPVLRRRGSA